MRKIAWLLAIVLVIASIAQIDALAAGVAKPTRVPTPKPAESPTKPPRQPTPTPATKPTREAKPTRVPTSTPEPKHTRVPSPTPEPTAMPSPTPVLPTNTSTPAPTSTPEPTAPPAPTPVPTATPAPVPVEGRVFDDRDQDGAQDPDEPGVAGVAVVVDDEVAAATDAEGHFSVSVPGKGHAVLSIIVPDGWKWAGEPVDAREALESGSVHIALARVETGAPAPPAATTVTGTALLAALAAALAFAGVVGLTVAARIGSLERTYRQHKAAELEQLQFQEITARRAEILEMLREPEGWRAVVDQVLADAIPETGNQMSGAGLQELSTEPAPHFAVAGTPGRQYVFTTSPEALRRAKMLKRGDRTIPLDAGLHPAARVEIQEVWEHLAAQRPPSTDTPVLPRQAAWYLVVRRAPAWRPRARRKWWRFWS